MGNTATMAVMISAEFAPRDGLPSLPRQTMGLLTHYCRLTMGRPNQVQWGRKSSPHNIKLMAYSTEGFPWSEPEPWEQEQQYDTLTLNLPCTKITNFLD